MKTKFVETIVNVVKFYQIMDKLQSKRKEKIAVLFSEPGLGKTESIIFHSAKNSSPMIRGKASHTIKWFLEELAEKLGLEAERTTSRLFNQVCEHFIANPQKSLFIDEMENLAPKKALVETIRDLHDVANVGIVMTSNLETERQLARYKALNSRIVGRLRFQPLGEKDIRVILGVYFENVEFEADAIRALRNKTKGNFRDLDDELHVLKDKIRLKSLKKITPEHING